MSSYSVGLSIPQMQIGQFCAPLIRPGIPGRVLPFRGRGPGRLPGGEAAAVWGAGAILIDNTQKGLLTLAAAAPR